jgi:hypothetical protein
VLRIKYVQSNTEKNLGKDEVVHEYNVTVTQEGSNQLEQCVNFSRRPNTELVVIYNDATFFGVMRMSKITLLI